MLEKAKDEIDNKGEDEIQNLLEKVNIEAFYSA